MPREKITAKREAKAVKLKKLNTLVESLCGLYTRVAQRLGVHRSFVSRVARGERSSAPVAKALLSEYDRVDNL